MPHLMFGFSIKSSLITVYYPINHFHRLRGTVMIVGKIFPFEKGFALANTKQI